ncbi:MAG: carboxypeptidase regulatory-like domain-containing protein [Candidatus Hydrogenedentota bacterium]
MYSIAILMMVCSGTQAADLRGAVFDESGSPLRGVMISAIDETASKSVSVFSSATGQFTIDGLKAQSYLLRARTIGKEDTFLPGVNPSAENPDGITFTMAPVDDINEQRRGDNLLDLLKFDNQKDKMNFKMSCTGCHQVGTEGFRAPEQPVDWETMISRMDGFGGLYKHTRDSLVTRLLNTYSEEAMTQWPEYTPPPQPDGDVLTARITEWDIGIENETNAHDLEIGQDGKVYVVDMDNGAVIRFDPDTGNQETYPIPGGAHAGRSRRILGPHSIEADANGDMWMTLAIAGKMAKFDTKTHEYTIVSGFPAPAERGRYPHTLRIDKQGTIWYTDAGAGVFSLHPDTHEVKQYDLPTADQAVGGGKGESRGRTPYGIDIAPDGKVWYTKLNGNRVGRIDPSVPDGDVKEWVPPFRGPRRLHVAPNGIVWVPGFGSGVLGKFDPTSEEWTVYPLPDPENQIPYALNVHPTTGEVWICGTGNDTIIRFNPETEVFTHYPMPSRVTYTREIEFDAEGNVWTSNSNVPIRHSERGFPALIKIDWDN